jgi:hypothetical protein
MVTDEKRRAPNTYLVSVVALGLIMIKRPHD